MSRTDRRGDLLVDHNKQSEREKVTADAARTGQAGRPRVFQDDDFFRATTRVLAGGGYGHLTLEAVARELGCTGAAVSRRFGSKRGLVRSYLEWSLAAMAARFQAVRVAYASPIEALRARGTIPASERMEEIGDPADSDRHANMATFWAEMRRDREFRQIFNRHMLTAEREAGDLLRAALECGELIECDPDRLGRTLTAAWSWTTTTWSGDSAEESLVDRLGQVFDTIVGPYRTGS
jgi:AcrR family transcriptional regulator